MLDVLDGYSVCYVGHSMGGAVGVLSRDERIRLLVSLAGMVHTHAFAEREFGEEVPDEGCMWDEPDCPLSQAYMDDMAQIDTVVRRGAEIVVPWLLVHGSEDDVVPIDDSHDILARASGNAELVVIDGADHVFSEHAQVMVEKVVGWLQGYLKGAVGIIIAADRCLPETARHLLSLKEETRQSRRPCALCIAKPCKRKPRVA